MLSRRQVVSLANSIRDATAYYKHIVIPGIRLIYMLLPSADLPIAIGRSRCLYLYWSLGRRTSAVQMGSPQLSLQILLIALNPRKRG